MSKSVLVHAVLAIGAAISFACTPLQAAERTFQFNIPGEPLSQALRDYGEATGQQLIFTEDLVSRHRAAPLRGAFDADEALRHLLEGTGLAVERTPNGALMIVRSPGKTEQTAERDSTIDEVIVTATKREEPVRRISGSVTAFDRAGLEAVGAESFADYLTRTPGVVFNQAVPGNSSAIIRGIATTTGIAQAQGTTGYFINDVPLTDPFYSSGIPDIDTFDVDNIGILRGPQGTLFGSASMGGAINYQAAKPDLAQFLARVRGTVESTHGGATSYSGRMMLNAPIATDVFAVRGVFDYRLDGGYVDNGGIGRNDSNETKVRGGRVLATYVPTAGTTFNYMFLQQTQDTDDAGFIEPSVGPYAKLTAVAEPFNYRVRIHNLRLDQELPFATLTATASRHEKTFSGTQDFSNLLPPAFAPVSFLEPGTSDGNTFEVRLASPTGGRFEYLVGVFHDSTNEAVINRLIAPAAAAAFGTATVLDAAVLIDGKESALFGEATWRFDEHWKATLGGRYFETRLDTKTTQSGPLVGGDSTTLGDSRETGFSPKVSLTWTRDEDWLVYGLISKGFRFGGPNVAVDPNFAVPSEFGSDSLVNYEIGTRANLFERRLQLDGTIYYIDWSDIQVTARTPGGFTYTANAGRARNSGFEGIATFRPSRNLSLQTNVTYLNSELRKDFQSASGIVPKGASLPGASDWQVSDSIIYTIANVQWTPTFVLSHRYLSESSGALVPAPQKQGGYSLVDLRASANLAKLTVAAFVENIGDKRGVTQAVTTNRGPSEFVVRPRTYGMTLDYRF